VLLESTPVGIDADSAAASLDRLDGVRSVHHLHVRAVDPTTAALTAHVELGPDTDLHTAQEIADRSRHLVAE